MFIVVMFVCSVSVSVREHNKYPVRHKETGAGLYPVPVSNPLTVPTSIHQKSQQKQYLFFQGKFSACWRSDEYRPGKQILIDCKEPGETLERTAPTCINCILIQSRCKAFSAGKLIVIPFSLNTIQLTRQTLFMSSLEAKGAFFFIGKLRRLI